MSTFIDTAAFLAVLNANDRFHAAAKQTWFELLTSDEVLFSSNYVLVETAALLQHRFGIEAVRLFQSDLLPVVETIWIDESIHQQALSALLAANRRDLSLVDCTSFEVMRQKGLDLVFTLDPHFLELGFKIKP